MNVVMNFKQMKKRIIVPIALLNLALKRLFVKIVDMIRMQLKRINQDQMYAINKILIYYNKIIIVYYLSRL